MHVISTAGHVDHGKSTLIHRISGIDPDRLPQEKERGLTIDLGFAWLVTPGGNEVGIVDVPGHERFIHNMLAGAGSVDATLFVIAANEGWMPQSEEHLAILDLLGARSAVIAITKADTVSADTIDAVFEQVRTRIAGTSLHASEIVAVSAATGGGLPELLVAIDRMLARIGGAPDRDRPRVFVDRTFTIQGVGTVATGTLTGGTLRTGDTVVVLPSGVRTRVRAIQTHRKTRDAARPVSRVALNLAGLERDSLSRGDAIVLPGQWEPTTELDVTLRAVRSLDHPIDHRSAYKAYVGSAEVDARVYPYDGTGYARLALAQSVVAAPFDRFVLRDVGRQTTAGGGVILDAHPPTVRGGGRATRVDQLRVRERSHPDDIPGVVAAELGVVERARLELLAGSAARPRDTVSLRSLEVARAEFERLVSAIEAALATFHERQPLVRGISREDVRLKSGIRDQRLFGEVVEAIGDRVVGEGPLLRLATHRVVLSLEQADARDVLLRHLSDAAFSPPGLASLIDSHGEPLVRALMDDGTLVRLTDDIVFAREQLEHAKESIARAVERDGPLTASAIKALLGTTRKYAIPLLEHLDATGFTRRNGDVRTLA